MKFRVKTLLLLVIYLILVRYLIKRTTRETFDVNTNPPSLAILMTVRNCEKYLPFIFRNLNSLCDAFGPCTIIFAYDNCTDNSAELLNKYAQQHNNSNGKVKVIVKEVKNNNSRLRTVRIAKARNACLEQMEGLKVLPEYFIVVDPDNINEKPWNVPKIKTIIEKTNAKWDSVSFNTVDYYDVWALQYGEFMHHCWGYRSGNRIVDIIRKDILKKLSKLDSEDFLECYSAFNGFAIYKTEMFKGLRYDGLYENGKKLYPEDNIKRTNKFLKSLDKDINLDFRENKLLCEHIYYHMTAMNKRGAKIRISPQNIFTK